MLNQLLLVCFALQVVLAIDEHREGSPIGGSMSGGCKLSETYIDGKLYCSRCSVDTDLLIDGKCVAPTSETEKICISTGFGRCVACGDGYFLYGEKISLFGYGCYKIGGEIGGHVCSEASGDSTVCKTCAPGYFKSPIASKLAPPCIRCNTTVNQLKYQGVDWCSVCELPKSPGPVICTKCEAGYFLADGNTCEECHNSCSTCTGAGDNKCTSCKDNKYVKVIDLATGAGLCIMEDACSGNYFPVTDKGACYQCDNTEHGGVVGCKECTVGGVAAMSGFYSNDDAGHVAITCTKCADGTKLNTAKTKCVPCNVDGCAHCDTDNVCAQCSEKKYLTPTNVCIFDCTIIKGYYGDASDSKRVCKPCIGCAECKEIATKCTACPAGQMLEYTDRSNPKKGGVCVEQCTVSLTITGCRNCGSRIDGTRYCKACKGENEVPIDGVCVNNGAARSTLCEPGENGTCKSCNAGDLWRDGGCYKTDRLPGRSICAVAKDGVCSVCSNSLKANNGVCGKCHPSCELCLEVDKADKCLSCPSGYYKSNPFIGTCTPCKNVIPSCQACKFSGGNVVCLLENNSRKLGAGPIAAIAAVIIIVIGILVGFLWWRLGCSRKTYIKV